MKLAVLLLPLAALAALEMGLRIGGYGYPAGFFLKTEDKGRKGLTENPEFTRRFFPKGLSRRPCPFWVATPKPSGTLRVAVFGESAAMGDPKPAYGFCRVLEVLLQEAWAPAPVEVVNTGVTAINSHAIREIAEQAAVLEADFWVVYMGHNEVVGPFGPGTIFGAHTPPLRLVRAALWLKTWRLGQLLDAWGQWLRQGGQPPANWQGMAMFLQHTVAWNDPRMERVYRHFESNCRDILRAGRKAGARIILCTAGSNLADCAPFASQHRPGLTGAELARWQELVRHGAELADQGRVQEALELFQQALKLDADYAELHYRAGKAQAALGQLSAAAQSYQRARDLDALRFRADSRLNEITRRLARGRTTEGIYFVDAEARMAQASPGGVPGRNFFWEHVHLNFEGNYFLAREVAEAIAQAGGLKASAARPATNWLTAAQVAERLAWTDKARQQTAQEIRQRLGRPPFTRQLDQAAQLAWLQELASQEAPSPVQAELHALRRALEKRPHDWELRAKLAETLEEMGEWNEAMTQWRQVAALLPHLPQAYYGQGNLLLRQGRSQEAIALFQEALRLKPDAAEAWTALALCYQQMGRLPEAVARLEKAIRRNPADPDLYYNLAIALAWEGQTNRAVANYRKALELQPWHENALNNLANLLIRAGRLPEAAEVARQFLQVSPHNASAHNTCGIIRARQHHAQEALAHFREAVRCHPQHWEARFNLASLCMAQGLWAEAVQHWEALVAARPDWPQARQRLEMARRALRPGGASPPP